MPAGEAGIGTEAAAAETIPQVAQRLNVLPVTVWRWVRHGLLIEGKRVKLLARRVGGRWMVSREAWEAFDRDCNPGAGPLPESPTKLRRRLAAEKAAALKLIGR
jgi:hypothetical protein